MIITQEKAFDNYKFCGGFARLAAMPLAGLLHDGPPMARLRRFRAACICHRQRRPAIPNPTHLAHRLCYNARMNIIYADTLFGLSVFTDYLLLLVTARFCALRLRRRRYLAAAVLGGVYAVAVFLPGLGFLAHPLCELCAAGVMGLVAFGCEDTLFRCCLAFLAVSASFGGAAWAVCMRSPGRPAPDLKLLVGVFLGSYAVLTLLSYTRRRRAREHRVSVTLTRGAYAASFTVLEDSGNCLCDPLTGERALLAAPAALYPLFPGQEALLSLGAAELVSCAEMPCRFRLLPCTGVAGPALLAAFRPDSVTVDGEERALLVAVSENAKGDGFEGII